MHSLLHVPTTLHVEWTSNPLKHSFDFLTKGSWMGTVRKELCKSSGQCAGAGTRVEARLGSEGKAALAEHVANEHLITTHQILVRIHKASGSCSRTKWSRRLEDSQSDVSDSPLQSLWETPEWKLHSVEHCRVHFWSSIITFSATWVENHVIRWQDVRCKIWALSHSSLILRLFISLPSSWLSDMRILLLPSTAPLC